MENKGTDQSPLPKMPKPVERWGYETHFKEYLLLLATKGAVALETSERYPKTIELGKTWHGVLNSMRDSTKADGTEKWAFVGVKSEKRGIFLPTIPVRGLEDYVPAETMQKMKHWARNGPGIVDFLGEIHSHPMDLVTSLKNSLISRIAGRYKLVEEFSAGDYYYLIVSPNSYFIGVTAGEFNIFAFKSRESTGLGVDKQGFPQDQFEKYWYEKFGFRYLGPVEKFGARRAISISDNSDSIGMNIHIARRHRLVLYQGQKNKSLTKIFPR